LFDLLEVSAEMPLYLKPLMVVGVVVREATQVQADAGPLTLALIPSHLLLVAQGVRVAAVA
jgi:hypothetical protein